MYRKSARTEKEYYARLSNGPMKSFNRKPKDLKRDSRGFSDFNYTRYRILWLQGKILV
ncbi:transposase [Holdemanella biformis]